MSHSFNSRRGTRQIRKAPGRVRHEEFDVTRRAQESQLLHKVMKLTDLEDTPLFPKGYRPKYHHHWL